MKDEQTEVQQPVAAEKVCPQCGRSFPVDEPISHCPDDTSLLAFSTGNQRIGQIIANRYEVTRLLGAGGWGSVFLATDRVLKRNVALKILHSYLTDSPDKVQRFEREAQIAASLSHPGIISVFDFGLTNKAEPYIVTDYMVGESLDIKLERDGRLPWQTAVPMFIQACDALMAAHSADIIHRDIKPSNIFLAQYAGSQVVKVLDFGLARFAADSQGNLTKTGETVGTPTYMSPEQCTGQHLDARSDLYSFGCVMYEVLTGELVASGSIHVEIMWKHLRDDPKAFEDLDPDLEVPALLEACVMRLLAKDPKDRFQSAQQLRDKLQELIPSSTGAGQAAPGAVQPNAAQAGVAGAGKPVAPWKNSTMIGIGALAALVLIVGAIKLANLGPTTETSATFSDVNLSQTETAATTGDTQTSYNQDRDEISEFFTELKAMNVTGTGTPGAAFKAAPKDIDSAIAFYTKQIAATPNEAKLYYRRALFETMKNDQKSAVQDLSKSISLSTGKPTLPYDAVLMSILQKQAKQDAPATAALNSAAAQLQPSMPAHPIVQYFQGKTTDQQMLDKTAGELRDNEEAKVKALVFIGLQNLVDGKQFKASKYLHSAVNQGAQWPYEQALAQHFLSKLEEEEAKKYSKK